MATTQVKFSNTTDVSTMTSAEISKLTVAEIGAFTKLQQEALTAEHAAGLSDKQVAVLPTKYVSPDVYTGLTTKALAGLPIKAMSVDQFAALTPTQMNALTSSQTALVSAKQWAEVSADGIGALSTGAKGGLAGVVMKNLGDNFSLLNEGQVAQLSAEQIKGITAKQAGAITSEQAGAFTDKQAAEFTPSLVKSFSDDAVGGLTSKAIGAIPPKSIAAMTIGTSGNIDSLSEDNIIGLNSAQLAALKSTQIAALSSNDDLQFVTTGTLVGLTKNNISGLDLTKLAGDGQFAALKASQIANFSTTQIASIDATGAEALTSAVLAAMSSTQLAKLSATDVLPNIAPEAFVGLTAKNIKGLTSSQIKEMLPEQAEKLVPAAVKSFTTEQVAGFESEDFAALTPQAVKAIKPTTLAEVDPTVFAALSADQIQALSGAQMAKLQADQILKLTPEQTEVLSPAQVAKIDSAIINQLPSESLAALPASAAAKISDLSQFTSAQVFALTDEQAAKLTVAQLQTLSTTASTGGIRGLSATHVGNDNMRTLSGLSSTQLQALSTNAETGAIPALTTKQMGKFTATELSYFTPAETTALSTDVKEYLITTKKYATIENSTDTTSTHSGIQTDGTITAYDNAETITSGSGADSIDAAAGNDTIIAGAGNDTINGSTGDDSMTGGEGADVFVFAAGDNSAAPSGTVFDTITDWNEASVADKIDFGSTALTFVNNPTTAVAATASLASGIASFHADDDTLAERVTAVENAIAAVSSGGNTPIAGNTAVFTHGSDSYVFISDGTDGVGASDVLIKLTDVSATAVRLSSGDLYVTEVTPPTAPTIDVATASDTGTSTTDNTSSDTTPTVRVTFTASELTANATATLYAGSTSVGTATLTATNISNGYVDITASALDSSGDGSNTTADDGTYTLTATVTNTSGYSSPASGSISYVLDTAVGSLDAVDLDAAGGVNASTTVNSTEAAAGKSIAANVQAPSATDIGGIKIVLAGAGLDTTVSKDQLVLDSAKSLNADFTGSNVTINSITGLDYAYTASTKTLIVAKNGGGALTAASVDNIVAGILFKTASTTQGDRTATISYIDEAGNAGTSAVSTLTVDTVAPTVTLFASDKANGSYKAAEVIDIDATTSEAVTSGQTVIVTLSTGDSVTLTAAANGTALTGNYTVGAGDTSSDLTVTAITGGTATDAAGNAIATTMPAAASNIAANSAIVVDTTAPAHSGGTITLADTALKAGDTSLVTFTFPEAVTGFANADVTLANGTMTNVASADGGVTWTATFTPSTNTEDATNVITVDMTALTDIALNAGTGTLSSGNFTIDTLAPAHDGTNAAITLSDSALKIGDTATVTIVFSEAVSGFSNADITVPNGTLTAVTSADNITWTGTFTPNATTTDATNTIDVTMSGLTDTAGNAGTGTLSSGNFTIDTQAPTAVSITLTDNGGSTAGTGDAGDAIVLTFSEAVGNKTAVEDLFDLVDAYGDVTGRATTAWTVSDTVLTVTLGTNETIGVVAGTSISLTGVQDVATNSTNLTFTFAAS